MHQVTTPTAADRRHDLGRAIRRARLGRMTQTELAEAIGVPQSTISQWENGHHQPQLERILQFEQALGLLPGVLASEAGYLRPSPGGPQPTPKPESHPLAAEVAQWAREFGPIVDSILLLEDLGFANDAEALRQATPVRRLRAGVDFVAAVDLQATATTATTLAEWLGLDHFDRLHRALWGLPEAADPPTLRVVPPITSRCSD